MKKAIVWILLLCLLLAVTGCQREAGSLPLSSADSQLVTTDAPPEGEEGQPSGSEGEADASLPQGESSQAEGETSTTPSEFPPVTTETEPPPAASSMPETGLSEGETSVPVISTVSLPTSYFDPPAYEKVYEHNDEDTLEKLIAWINSPEALTEEDGVYKEAVEYYRDRGYLFCPVLGGELPDVAWISFRSNGTVVYVLENEDSGSIWCSPFQEHEAQAASGGIVSYLEDQNITMIPDASAPLPGQEYPMSVWRVGCIETWSPKQVQLADGTKDAVLRVLAWDPEDKDGRVTFTRHLHWLEGGFHFWLYSHDTSDPVEAYTPNQAVLSQVQMINVPLTGSNS